jgi:hypothetical protein
MKLHDKEFFYKYVTSDTAIKILSNIQVRWSSPLLFNDPFDTQLKLRFGFDFDNLVDPLVEEIQELTFSEYEPKLNQDAEIYKIIKLLRALGKKLPPNIFKELYKSTISEGVTELKNLFPSYQKAWEDYLSNTKLFCVAEKPNNLLMWAHYSQNHTGVVFRFKCIPEADTALCAARTINYQSEIPIIASLEEWVKHITGQARFNFEKIFNEFVFTKSEHWSFEKEWRCFTIRESEEGRLFVMLELLPEEIDGVILGCRIKD